jgi:hypothetical protein
LAANTVIAKNIFAQFKLKFGGSNEKSFNQSVAIGVPWCLGFLWGRR